jgi:hypothetical protein
MYIELLNALGVEIGIFAENNLIVLKNRLMAEVRHLEADIDLVIIFDNFRQSLQKTLGESFFNFLFALRNARPRLNLSYIFMANLKIDFAGFYKIDRLFDKGADRSICWLSLLNQKDVFFSIDRQWRKVEEAAEKFSQVDKERIKKRIYQLGAGHALLGRYLSHLMLSGELTVASEPNEILAHQGIYDACTAIWNDLDEKQKDLLIELVKGNSEATATDQLLKEQLERYGVLKERTVFSPLFAAFVLKSQDRISPVIEIGCDENKTKIAIQTVDRKISFPLSHLTPNKEKLLPPTARGLLCYLVEHQNETCSRDRLIEAIWPSDKGGDVTNRALDAHIERIKDWLKEQSQLNPYIAIETVRSVGYKLVVKH